VFGLNDWIAGTRYSGVATCAYKLLPTSPFPAEDLRWAGVQVTNRITIYKGAPPLAAWGLVQVNQFPEGGPGTVLIPVKAGAGLVSYTKNFGGGQVGKGVAAIEIDGKNECWKCAVAPEDYRAPQSGAAMVYLAPYSEGQSWFCVMLLCRGLPVNQTECLDRPRGEEAEQRGGAIQLFNGLGGGFDPARKPARYAELELHGRPGHPARGGAASMSADLAYEVHGYVGQKRDLLALAKNALEIAELPVLYGAG
jgi:hypothetical protein